MIFDYSAALKITFDKPIAVDPEIITGTEYYKVRPLAEIPISLYSSGDYAGFPGSNAFDSSAATYWRTSTGVPTTPFYLARDFGAAVTLTKIRLALIAPYCPYEYAIQGSDNNVSWTTVVTCPPVQITGWVDFTFAAATYRYWRVYITQVYDSALYIAEIEFYNTRNTYQTTGWIVTAQEKNMIPTGVSAQKSYVVYKISRTPDSMAVIVWLDAYDRIKYPVDQVTVSFSGNLIGADNVNVAPFSIAFSPINIAKIFNPNDAEHISMELSAIVASNEVEYEYYRSKHENISLQIESLITVTKVGSLPL